MIATQGPVNVRVTHSGITPAVLDVPDFPMLRVDGDRLVYQEVLINGQYLGVHLSAMGRPKSRGRIWEDLHAGASWYRPTLRTRQHAFILEIDGQLLADRWEWVGSRTNCDDTVITLRHLQRPVTVEVHTSCDGTPFFTRHLVITNTGERPCAVAKIAPWSGLAWSVGVTRPSSFSKEFWYLDDVQLQPLSRSPFSVGRMTDSSWAAEGAFDWTPMPPGRSGFESMNGHSGFGAPSCFLRNDASGELLVVDLAWSGNWSIELFNDFEPARRPQCDARAYVEVGLAGPAPVRVLERGESAATPKVHVGALFGDLDTAVQARHWHIRASVAPAQPKDARHLVELNTYSSTYPYQVAEDQLYADIDLAAELGAELFVLDAGWFDIGAQALSWHEAVGDWDQESPLLPKGVRAALDRVREKGMRAGLMVEPERVGLCSKNFKEHPDRLMRRRGEAIPNLDLSQPAVAEHVENTIIGIVDRYQLDCLRIDYNHRIGEAGEADRGGYTENVLWRYYDALYRIFDNMRQRYPHLLLENCASGGGRMDLGMMSRFHWTQVSDRSSPAPAARIRNGATILLPPEQCESFMGTHSEGVSDIDFLIRVGMFGHFIISGIFPTLNERNTTTWDRWRHGIDLYKNFCRPLLSTSRMFHHTPIQRQTEPGEWIVWECADPGGDRAYAGIFRLLGADGETYHFRPRGLHPDRTYRIRYDTAGWNREIAGGTLIDSGIRVPVSSALTSELLLIEAA